MRGGGDSFLYRGVTRLESGRRIDLLRMGCFEILHAGADAVAKQCSSGQRLLRKMLKTPSRSSPRSPLHPPPPPSLHRRPCRLADGRRNPWQPVIPTLAHLPRLAWRRRRTACRPVLKIGCASDLASQIGRSMMSRRVRRTGRDDVCYWRDMRSGRGGRSFWD